jgi:hypothetical protein
MRLIFALLSTMPITASANDFADCLDHHAGVVIFAHEFGEFVWHEHEFVVDQVDDGVATATQVEKPSRALVGLQEHSVRLVKEYERSLFAYCESLRP